MTPRQKILSLIAFAIIGVLGFGVGQHIFRKETTKAPSSNTAQPIPTPTPAITDKTYIISPPSTGVMATPLAVEFSSVQDSKAIILLSGEDANDITIDDNVLVYDQNKTFMGDVIGKVTSILDESSNPQNIKKRITVSFYGVDPQKFSFIKSGDIILKKNEQRSLPRLPLSALVLDKDKNEFYWVIDNQSETKTTAHLKPAQGIIKTDEFFVPHLEFGKSYLFILYPDEQLKEGAIIQTTKILYQAPPYTKDEVLIEKIRQDIDAKNDVIRNDAFYSKPGELTIDYSNPDNGGCPTPTMSEAPSVDDSDSSAPIFTPACGIPEDAGLPLLVRP